MLDPPGLCNTGADPRLLHHHHHLLHHHHFLHHHHRPLSYWRGWRATSASLKLVTGSAQYKQEDTIVWSFLHHQVTMVVQEARALAGLIRAAGSKHSKSASFSFLPTLGEGGIPPSTELQSA